MAATTSWAVTASGSPLRLALVEHDRTGQQSQYVENRVMRRHPEADRPFGRDGLLYRRGQLLDQAFGMMILDHQGHGTGPTTPRQTLAQRADVRHEIQGILGTAHRQGQRPAGIAMLGRDQLVNGRLAQRRGRQAVYRLGREGDDLAFGKCLHRGCTTSRVSSALCRSRTTGGMTVSNGCD